MSSAADISAISKLPHNLEAEQMIIGAMLRDNRICDTLEDILSSEVFYEPLHQRIFEQIIKIKKRGIVANEVSLKIFFDYDQDLIDSGGAEYLAKLAAKSSIIFDIHGFAKIILDAYLRRCLIEISNETITDAYNYDAENPAIQQIEQVSQKLFLLSNQGRTEKTYTRLSGLLDSLKQKIEFAKNNNSSIQGVTTGFRDLDQLLGGLQKSDLIILAARPSMGKTALAINLALNAAKSFVDNKSHVGFFSLEMSAEQLASRIISIESGISSYRALSGKITTEEMHKILETSTKIGDLPFIIDDASTISISGLRTRIRRMHQIYNLSVVFIDYLQLIKGSSKRSGENRVQEVSEVTQGLKAIAKELNIPIVALSQLSRLVEQRDDKKPQLSDLRDSGSIEQDADIVMFLYREEYYEIRKQPPAGTAKHAEWQSKMNDISNIADLLITKQRNGPIGNIKLFFESDKGHFKDYTAKYNT